MTDYELPPPLPKKTIGTISTNADQEFLKMLRDESTFQSCDKSRRREDIQRKSSKKSHPKQSKSEKQTENHRRSSSRPNFEDEDEATNFLIEENMRRNKRYFGASLLSPGTRGIISNGLNPGPSDVHNVNGKISRQDSSSPSNLGLPSIVLSQRNPTLGEIIRGETKQSSKRSLQDFYCNKRRSTNYSSERQTDNCPSNFTNHLIDPSNNFSLRKKSSLDSELDNIGKNNVKNKIQRPSHSKTSNQSFTSEKVWIESLGYDENTNTVTEVVKAIEKENKNPKRRKHDIKNNDKFKQKESAKLPLKNENDFLKSSEESTECRLLRKFLLKGKTIIFYF